MSRTRHALPSHSLHRMKVQNRRKMEEAVLDELEENEIASNQVRHINRLTAFWSVIPEPWDDKPCAAWGEYHNKNYWTVWREAQNEPHFTKHLAQNDVITDGFFPEGLNLMVIDFSRCR